MERLAVVALLSLFLVLVAAACTRSIAGDGQTCVLNSDCSAPLVCAATYCRPQCREPRDCETGETCHGVGDTAACVPDGMPVPCAYTSQCGVGRACVDQTCRASCAVDGDCTGGTCVMGACSMPVPSGADAGTPACASAICGGRCVDLMTDSEHCGLCPVACATGSACIGGTCVGCDPAMPGCRPTYDDCETPLLVDASMRLTVVTVPGAGVTNSAPSCAPSSDFFFDVRAPDRALVRTAISCLGSTGYLGDLASCASPLATCTSCASNVVELDRGTHRYLAECGNDATLSVTRIPLTGATDVEAFPASGALDETVTLPSGTGMGFCGATGGSHVWYLDSCGHESEYLTMDTCGSTVPLSVAFIGSTGGVGCSTIASTGCADGIHSHDLVSDGVSAVVISAMTPGAPGTVHVTGSFGP